MGNILMSCVSVVLHLGGIPGFEDARTPDVPNMTNSDIYNDSAHINEWWAVSTDNGPEDWGARLQLTFLFPK